MVCILDRHGLRVCYWRRFCGVDDGEEVGMSNYTIGKMTEEEAEEQINKRYGGFETWKKGLKKK